MFFTVDSVSLQQISANIHMDYLLSLFYFSFRALRAVSGLYDTFLLLLPAAELCLLDKTPHYSLYLQQLEEIKASMNVRSPVVWSSYGSLNGYRLSRRHTGRWVSVCKSNEGRREAAGLF